MEHLTIADLFQFVGGGSVLTLAIAIFKFARDTRDTLRDHSTAIGKPDSPAPTTVLGRIANLEQENKRLRDWALTQGYKP